MKPRRRDAKLLNHPPLQTDIKSNILETVCVCVIFLGTLALSAQTVLATSLANIQKKNHTCAAFRPPPRHTPAANAFECF